MKDVLWCGLLEFNVPHQGDAIRFMGSIFVVVVRGNKQLRILQERGRKRGGGERRVNERTMIHNELEILNCDSYNRDA